MSQPKAVRSGFYVTKGNISGLIDRLVAAGLVERRAIAADKRQHAIFLTEAGRKAAGVTPSPASAASSPAPSAACRPISFPRWSGCWWPRATSCGRQKGDGTTKAPSLSAASYKGGPRRVFLTARQEVTMLAPGLHGAGGHPAARFRPRHGSPEGNAQ